MEDEWFRLIKDRPTNIYPKNGQQVWVKIAGLKTKKYYECKAVFIDTEFYSKWVFEKNDFPIDDFGNLPDWWKPL